MGLLSSVAAFSLNSDKMTSALALTVTTINRGAIHLTASYQNLKTENNEWNAVCV